MADVLGLTEPGAGTRADQLFELADALVNEYGERDSMLEELEPYYFLDEEQDPVSDDERDEHLQTVRLPHGTDVIDLVQGMLADAGLQISVPARSEKKKDLDLADNAERWLQALLGENERMAGQGLLDRAAWLVAMRGAFCARVIFNEQHLEKDKAGTFRQGSKPAIVFQVRDPAVVYPKFGQDGLLYVAERWTRTVADVRYTWGQDLLPKKKPDDEVEWTELWTREEFCYWADGVAVEKEVAELGGAPQMTAGPWKHEYGDIPYTYRFAQQTGMREPEKRARPLLESVRHVIDSMNLLDTVELTTVSEYGGDSLLITSGRDDFELDLSPLAQNYKLPGETVEWLRTNRQPFEAQNARAKYEAVFQRSTFPYSMYGQDPGRVMSGFSLSVLNQGGQVRLRRIVEAIEQGMAELLGKALMLAEQVLAPLLDQGVVRAYFRAEQAGETGERRTVRQEVGLKALDLDGYYEVEVALGEMLPTDDQANLVMAVRTQQPGPNGRPLLSWQTAVERFKLADSPAEERWRIDQEMVANDPEVQALRRAIFAAKVVAELREEAEELGVDVEAVLEKAQMANEQMGAATQGAPIPPGMPGEMLAAGMQGAGAGEGAYPGSPYVR